MKPFCPISGEPIQTTVRWFYGFKLHGIVDDEGRIVNVYITAGNIHDNVVLKELLMEIRGIFVADAGFLVREEELKEFFKRHQILYIAPRKNMKRVMSKGQYKLMKRRSKIETLWDVLKERYGLVFHLARSFTGLLRHYFYSLLSYMFHRNYVCNYLLLNKI